MDKVTDIIGTVTKIDFYEDENLDIKEEKEYTYEMNFKAFVRLLERS